MRILFASKFEIGMWNLELKYNKITHIFLNNKNEYLLANMTKNDIKFQICTTWLYYYDDLYKVYIRCI